MVNKIRKYSKSSTKSTNPTEILNPELVFGIVGPIGVDLEFVVESLQSSLKDMEYNVHTIHLTKFMHNNIVNKKIITDSYFSRYESMIDYANEYRRVAKNKAALAGLAVMQIRKHRASVSNSSSDPILGLAYIVRQFKRQEEVDFMRRVYGRKFIQISVNGGEIERRSVLVNKIMKYDTSPKSQSECETQAIKLIEKDYNEIDNDNGQRVSEAFPLGDVFVDGINHKGAAKTIKRFIRALFGDNKISPDKDEYGLYIAAAASLRSIDLSRQVGAAIFSQNSEIISMGCNEVPKAGGGTYWTSDKGPTFRDADLGFDTNEDRKNEILFDLVQRLSQENLLSEAVQTPLEIQELINKIQSTKRIKDSQLMDILEYGRMIHAEMSAISDAARIGRPIKGGVLYSTTFPCHLCAKHIVASGIQKVIFLEPYPKSYAKKLHNDSITFDSSDKKKVIFQAFIGISPRRYRDLFEKRKRKSNGKLQDWYEGEPAPRIEDRGSGYIENEAGMAVYALGKLYGVKHIN